VAKIAKEILKRENKSVQTLVESDGGIDSGYDTYLLRKHKPMLRKFMGVERRVICGHLYPQLKEDWKELNVKLIPFGTKEVIGLYPILQEAKRLNRALMKSEGGLLSIACIEYVEDVTERLPQVDSDRVLAFVNMWRTGGRSTSGIEYLRGKMYLNAEDYPFLRYTPPKGAKSHWIALNFANKGIRDRFVAVVKDNSRRGGKRLPAIVCPLEHYFPSIREPGDLPTATFWIER